MKGADTWEQIRCKRSEVSWSGSVWFKQGIPRYAFLVWLAIQNRLSTGDRMRKWGIQQSYVLCGEQDETGDHLFFACPYSYTVWDRLASRLVGRRINPDWQDMLNFIQVARLIRWIRYLFGWCSRLQCNMYGENGIHDGISKVIRAQSK